MRAATRRVVWLGLSAALASSALPPPRVYPGATAVRVDLHDSAPGLVAEAAAFFVTSDPLAVVARFFHDRWRAQGLVTTADGEFLEEGVVGAFDVVAGRQHAVVLRRLGDGRTLVFVTEVPFEALWKVARVRVQVTAQGQVVTWKRAVIEDRP